MLVRQIKFVHIFNLLCGVHNIKAGLALGHARWLQGTLQRVAYPARLFLGPGGKRLFREWGTRVIQSMLFSVSGVGTWIEVKDGYSRILPRAGPRFPQGWVVG